MGEDLLDLVEREVNNNVPPEEIKEKLLQQGFLEQDIVKAIKKNTGVSDADKKLNKVFTTKEVFDRVGYGFVPHQFINILFYLTGANFLWLGIVNGLKSILSIAVSSIFQEYGKLKTVSKKSIGRAGYLFGFSFLGMAAAIVAKSVELFALFLLLGSIGVVTHGDLYNKLIQKNLKREKRSHFLARISYYGVLITGACMLVSGWLLDSFPVSGSETISLGGKTFVVLGYVLSFVITAIAFILSGYMLSHIKVSEDTRKVKNFMKQYITNMKINLGTVVRTKHLFLLITATILLGLAQVLGNSYYGVFIYSEFQDVGFKGFMNVAAIFFIAIIASFLGPWFSKKMNKTTGLAPTLVFGTLLVAMMPLALAYNPNLPAIGMANALSVIGASILGVSQGLLVNKLLRYDERKVYFSIVSVAAIIPFLVLVPVGAYYANMEGLVQLFKILAFGLIAVVVPLYLLLVLMGSKKKL